MKTNDAILIIVLGIIVFIAFNTHEVAPLDPLSNFKNPAETGAPNKHYLGVPIYLGTYGFMGGGTGYFYYFWHLESGVWVQYSSSPFIQNPVNIEAKIIELLGASL
jgi:hypothetical protein